MGRTLLFFLLIGQLLTGSVCAWPWGEKSLATVNGQTYTSKDFADWWASWREEGMVFPETAEPYVEWLLLAQEAEKMQLDQDPAFRAKVETFLKVRSLMILKGEEIDGRVSVSDDEAWAFYLQEYSPRWRINIFVFADRNQAEAKGSALREKSLTVEALAAEAGKDDGPQFHQAQEVRVPKLEESWRQALAEAVPGSISAPIEMEKGVVILRLAEVLPPDKEDFGKVKEGILDRLKKEKAGILTTELVQRLEKKYAVKVDEDVLGIIGKEPLAESDAGRIVIQTNRENIDAAAFWGQVEKERQFRKKFHFAEKEEDQLKRWVLANIISQTLISWEALDRRYEDREPFLPVYKFYRRHRLTKEIERRFVQPRAEVAEEEMRKYYDEHPALFTQPELVSIVLLEGEKDFIEKVWGEIVLGRDFFEVVREKVPGGVSVRQVPVNHLDEPVRAALEPLRKGETSKPFSYGENMGLLKLVGGQESRPIPFDAVREKLEQQLRKEKYEQVRADFIETLKSRSEIRVDEKEWEKVRRELEKTGGGAKNN